MQLLSSLKQLLFKKTSRLALVTLLYYVSLVFVNANFHLLIVTTLFALAVFWQIKHWWLTLWFLLLTTLPLAKGKTLVFTLIPREDVWTRNAIFDINYILSFYVSDGVLFTLYWLIIRQPIDQLKKLTQALMPLRWLGMSFLVFLAVIIWPHHDDILLQITLLSSVQLIKTVLLFLLPVVLLTVFTDRKKQFSLLTQIALLGSIFFQAALSLLQFLNGGPLGKYIEAILPFGKSGQPIAIRTVENHDILRVTGSFFDPSLLGAYAFSMFIWLWYQKPSITPLWLKWLALFATNMIIIFTSNRLLMLTLLLWWGCQAFVIFKRYYGQQKKAFQKTQFNWLVGLGIVFSILVIPYLSARFNSLTSLFTKYGSGTYRIELARYAIRLVNEQPWGVGLGLSPYFLATQFNQETVTFDPAPPHNIFFQLLAEAGFMGVVMAVWLIYLIYKPTQSKTKRLGFLVTGAGMAGLAFLYCAQFYPLFTNQIETFSWLMIFLGLYWAEKQGHLNANK